MKRILALAALAAVVSMSSSCTANKYYRMVSPESPLNLTLETNRPERISERIFLIGDVLKVVYFENTKHGYVYLPLTLGIDFEEKDSADQVWTPAGFTIRGPAKTPNDLKAESSDGDYLLLSDHRDLDGESLPHQDMWKEYYQKKWEGAMTGTARPDTTFLQATSEPTEDNYTEVGLRLITTRKFFEMGKYYELKFTPSDKSPPVSYVVQVDRNNAIVGASIGLTIIAVALAVSSGN